MEIQLSHVFVCLYAVIIIQIVPFSKILFNTSEEIHR